MRRVVLLDSPFKDWASSLHPHKPSFVKLRATLGAPLRTMSSMESGLPNFVDHVWRCGCAARERAGVCDHVPCERHGEGNRDTYGDRARIGSR